MADAAHHVPDPMHHVLDEREHWMFFERLFGEPIQLPLPGPFHIAGHEFRLTKFMILEVIAAALIIAIYVPLARRSKDGSLPKGRWWNAFESLLTFIRTDIAKPTLEHHADRFTPYLWTVFLFILFMNLLGMIPFMGSPTASISVTGVLAVCTFVLLHAAPISLYGVGRYLKSMWLDTGMNPIISSPISGMIFVIELFGTVIKSFVLAVRLFANMFAGHLVLSILMTFIVIAGNDGYSHIWPVVTTASVLGVVGLSLLELFVAFLQAYVFTFLTSLFLGMALHHCEDHHGEHAPEEGHGHGAGGHGHGESHGHGSSHGAAHGHGH